LLIRGSLETMLGDWENPNWGGLPHSRENRIKRERWAGDSWGHRMPEKKTG